MGSASGCIGLRCFRNAMIDLEHIYFKGEEGRTETHGVENGASARSSRIPPVQMRAPRPTAAETESRPSPFVAELLRQSGLKSENYQPKVFRRRLPAALRAV